MPGIIYISTGEKYTRQVVKSAEHNYQHTKYPMTLITDRKVSTDVFDDVIIINQPAGSFRDKVQYMRRTPYDYTLYLDSDCYLTRPVDHLFELLDSYDLAVAIDQDEWESRTSSHFTDVPEAVPEFNTGVLLYTKGADPLLGLWQNLFDDAHAHDQLSFRAAVHRSDVNIMTLSNGYNCFITGPSQICGEVKLLHYAGGEPPIPDVQNCIRKINSREDSRAFSEINGEIAMPLVPTVGFRARAIYKRIQSDGIISTVRDVYKYLK